MKETSWRHQRTASVTIDRCSYCSERSSWSCTVHVCICSSVPDVSSGSRSVSPLGIPRRTSLQHQTPENLQSYEPQHNQINKVTFAPSKDSDLMRVDQPGHPLNLIRVFSPHEQTLGPLLPIECTAKTPRLIRVFTRHTGHFAGFVVWQLIWKYSNDPTFLDSHVWAESVDPGSTLFAILST